MSYNQEASRIEFEKQFNQLVERYKHIFTKQKIEELTPFGVMQQIINYYENIINCMPGNVYWFNKDCVAVGANQNVLDMLNLSSSEAFKDLSYEEVGILAQWDPLETLFFKEEGLEVIKSGCAKINIEEPLVHNNLSGQPAYFLSSRVPLFDREQNSIGVVGISIDITELKQTQLELKKAKEAAELANYTKAEFVANMSHDIKTPLVGIIGISEILADRLQAEEQTLAKTLLMSGKQLLSFFENCLQVFKAETNNVGFEEESFSLCDLLQEIQNLFKPSILAKKLNFNIETHYESPLQLIGSRAGLFRILLNLLGNAVKFTEKGAINIIVRAITLSDEKVQLDFSVKDTGIGIPYNQQSIILDQFTRLTPSYKGIYEGHGIGLYIVDKFVKAMDGQIFVTSEEQKGSTFKITLPFKKTEIVYVEDEPLELIEKPILTSLSILVVEDNHIAQLMHATLLSSLGHQITLAENGEEAISVFSPGKFDLIFMDLGLPGMQGDEAAEQIRALEKDHETHVPIIALTAHIDNSMTAPLKKSGIDLVHSKPLSREKIKRLIQKIVINTNPG